MSATVTWAIPIEAHLLGARLESYVESKAAVSTFRLCAQNGNPSEASVSKLPAELTEKIVTHIQHPFFEKRFLEWVDVTNCLDGWCFLLDHEEDHYEDHQARLDRHLEKLSPQIQQSKEGKRFAKYRKVRH